MADDDEAVNRRPVQAAAGDDVSPWLNLVGLVTCSLAARTAGSQTADGLLGYPFLAGLGAVAGAFLCGLATLLAGRWVAHDAARRSATGRVILFASLLPLALVVSHSYGSDFLDILRAAFA